MASAVGFDSRARSRAFCFLDSRNRRSINDGRSLRISAITFLLRLLSFCTVRATWAKFDWLKAPKLRRPEAFGRLTCTPLKFSGRHFAVFIYFVRHSFTSAVVVVQRFPVIRKIKRELLLTKLR